MAEGSRFDRSWGKDATATSGPDAHWTRRYGNTWLDIGTLGLSRGYREGREQEREAERLQGQLGERPTWDALRDQQTGVTEELLGSLDTLRGKNDALARQGLPQESKDLYQDMADRMLSSGLNRNTAQRGGTGGINDLAQNVTDSYRQIVNMDVTQRLANKTKALANEANYLGMESDFRNRPLDREMTFTGSDMNYWDFQQDYIRQLMMAGEENQMNSITDARNLGIDIAAMAAGMPPPGMGAKGSSDNYNAPSYDGGASANNYDYYGNVA
jgi:hypothetical protein